MNELLVTVLVVFILIVLAAGAVLARRWVWRPVVAKRVVVQLDTGHAIEAIMLERRGPLLILADATVHESGSEPVKADGQSVVERSRVLWVQVL